MSSEKDWTGQGRAGHGRVGQEREGYIGTGQERLGQAGQAGQERACRTGQDKEGQGMVKSNILTEGLLTPG